jgi:hypothetical protein
MQCVLSLRNVHASMQGSCSARQASEQALQVAMQQLIGQVTHVPNPMSPNTTPLIEAKQYQ